MDPGVVNLLTEAGPIGILAFGIIGLVRGWIVPGNVHKKALEDAAFWRDAFLKGTKLAERVVESVEGK